ARSLCAYEKAVSDLLAAQRLLEELPLDEVRLALWGRIVEQLAPAYRGADQREGARKVLEEYIAACEAHGYTAAIARGCTFLGMFLELNPTLAGPMTSREMYERAIAVCEARGLPGWAIYPQYLLADQLSTDDAQVDRAEALVRACLPRAQARQETALV